MKKIGVIVLAGGKGNRFETEIPKQFISLNGRPVISYCLDTFAKHPDISYIVIATHKDWMEKTKTLCPSAVVVEGGSTRQESSLNALRACDTDTDYVLIHDAVRPFVDFKIINHCIKALKMGYRAVDTIISTYDTIVKTDEENKITEMPDRSMLYRGQTPQAFFYKDILEAYLEPVLSDIPPTDDLRFLFNRGIPCICVPGSEFNIKITTMPDLYLAERIAQSLYNAKTGNVDLTGKKCLVFGATGGIGKAIVDVFEENGAKIHGVGSLDLDLRHFDEYEQFFTNVRSQFGKVDILINAAGLLERGPLINLDFNTISSIIDVNFKAAVEITRIAVRTVMNKDGKIFHIGSSSWSKGRKEYAVYSAAKAALVNFVQAMAEELAPLHIKINCINPPRTDTSMRRRAFPDEEATTLMAPKSVAYEILRYCNSPDSGYVIDLKVGVSNELR